LHLPFHPQDPRSRQLQKLFRSVVCTACENSPLGAHQPPRTYFKHPSYDSLLPPAQEP
jgi:hypothetical protein